MGDLAAIGDRVRITLLTDGSGAIEEVEERKQAIVRLDPRPQGEYQQVLLANADQAVFVFACAHPNPKLRMLDRFLVIAEKQRVPAVIVANKMMKSSLAFIFNSAYRTGGGGAPGAAVGGGVAGTVLQPEGHSVT